VRVPVLSKARALSLPAASSAAPPLGGALLYFGGEPDDLLGSLLARPRDEVEAARAPQGDGVGLGEDGVQNAPDGVRVVVLPAELVAA
jgi:hypothetical protein